MAEPTPDEHAAELERLGKLAAELRKQRDEAIDALLSRDMDEEGLQRTLEENERLRAEVVRLIARYETCECGHTLSHHGPLGCDGCGCLTFDNQAGGAVTAAMTGDDVDAG